MTDNAQRRFRALSLITVSTLLLWACSGAPTREDEAPPPEPTVPESPVTIVDPFTLPASVFSAEFARTESQLAGFNWMGASAALQDIPGEELERNDADYLNYLNARIAYIRGDQDKALARLRSLDTASTDPALRYRGLSFQQHILGLSGQHLAAAKAANKISDLVPPEYQRAWQRRLWHKLQWVNNADIQAARGETIEHQWQAWLELALISREQGHLRMAELARWQSDNSGHPGAVVLPGGLGYLLNPLPAPQRVALLLPLSGRLAPAGQAVLDGYLAAHFKQTALTNTGVAPAPEVLVLDTAAYAGTIDAYEEALRRGAQFVIGPLHKEGVADLLTYPARPVPVLALNRVTVTELALNNAMVNTANDATTTFPALEGSSFGGDLAIPASGSALVQASLSPEDEARQLATLAFGEGARSAVIVRPAGDWGVKIEKALTAQWHSLGGKIADSAVFSTQETYSESLTGALGLSAGRQRSRMVRDMLADNVEFTPRRREDIQAVFLLTRNGAQARAIKPLLAFHYAGTLPVYTISTVYNGIPDTNNRDLNGTITLETPWLLGDNQELRATIAAGDRDNGGYSRLNALGADAHLLQAEFSRLQAGPDALLRGNTGLLSLNPDLQILRESQPATFDRGVLTPR